MSENPAHVSYGFVGLGHQGTPMVQRMIECGLRPWVWARRSEVLDRYRRSDARVASSLAELGARCDVVGLCLYDADATEAVLFGPTGLVSAMRPNTVLAIHSTVGSDYIDDVVSRTAARGISVVDAPVSGGDLALARQLLVIVAGDEEPCARCNPMFDAYAGRVVKVGAAGAAQAAKLVNNALMMAMGGLVIDAFDLGRNLGIDVEALGEVLANGSAANPSVGSYLEFGAEQFAIRSWPTLHKDLELLRAIASRTATETSDLMSAATAAIRHMELLRAPYVAAKKANK